MGYLAGTEKSDTMTGSISDDSIYGLAGDDSLDGAAGNDLIDGGVGNDTLDGGSGNNTLIGGEGNDTYIIRNRLDILSDAGGIDTASISVDWFKGALASIENVSWSTDIQKLPYWIDALTFSSAPALAAEKLAQGTIYFGFPESSLLRTANDKSFVTLPESHRVFLREFFTKLGKQIGVTFLETKDLTLLESHLTIIFNGADLGPIVGADGGDRVRINTLSQPFPVELGVPYFAYVHEVGHVLGLKHPFGKPDGSGNVGEGPFLPAAEDAQSVTLMSYTRNIGETLNDFGILDRASLHYLYGVSPAYRAGDTTHGLTMSAPNFITDGSGTDTVDGRALPYSLVLNMSPGSWSYTGAKSVLITANAQITINFGTDIERAQGGSGNDLVVGNKLDNMIAGNMGDDTLEGGAGNDTLLGGLGADVARFVGKAADYQVTDNADGSVNIKDINSADGDYGTDLLRNIERVEFSNGESLKLATVEAVQTLTSAQIVSMAAFQNGNWVNLDNGSNTFATEILLKGKAIASASVLVMDNDVPVGIATASTAGEWTLSLKDVSAVSTHRWSARVVDDLGNSGPASPAWSATVFLPAVTVTPGTLYWEGTLENDVVTAWSGSKRLWGGAGNDSMIGGGGNELIRGGEGDDFLDGGLGANEINGGSGNDVLKATGSVNGNFFYADLGDDTVIGGSGPDTLDGGLGTNFVDGGAGDDVISLNGFDEILKKSLFSLGNNTLIGGEGNDAFFGGEGNDLIFGNDGNDIVAAGLGNDTVDGGAGNDILRAGFGSNSVVGGDGNDNIEVRDTVDRISGPGENTLEGGAGDDSIEGGNGNDRLDGGDGKDMLNGGLGSNAMDGGAGDDNLSAFTYQGSKLVRSQGSNTFIGGEGNDVVLGGDGNDLIFGNDGNDIVEATYGDDTVDGGAGNDVVSGGSGNNVIIGGTGNDNINLRNLDGTTGAGNNTLSGGEGNDSIDGGDGNDRLDGGDGTDRLNGGDGTDRLDGGDGADMLNGGLGSNTIDGGAGDDNLAAWTYQGSKLVQGQGSNTMNGGSGNDVLSGADGPDFLNGGSGNDVLNGGQGIDVAAYAGKMADYVITRAFGGLTITSITGMDGKDSLQNIERLQFSDKSMAFDLEGNAGKVTKILGTVFGKSMATDPTYFGIGLRYMDAGMSYEKLMQAAINTRLGAEAVNNSKIVELIYTNILGVAPPQSAAKHYVDLLEKQVQTAGSLGVLAAESSYNHTNINLVGLISTGVTFI